MAAALAAGCGGGESDEEAAPAAPPGTATQPAEPGAEPPPATSEEPQAGGVYRVDWEASFNFTNGFDPTGEYLGEVWGIYSSLLIRTLVGYRHTAGAAGTSSSPISRPISAGLRRRAHVHVHAEGRHRVRPTALAEITSADIAFAFERIGTASLVAQYSGYYQVIEGMPEFSEGTADTISGIETPDDKTIVFRLSEPTGDFLYRLAMPATGPMPEEVAGCFDQAGEYGRYVISSGPYMIEGSDALDASSCETLKPISGFDGDTALTLVRNPDYDPATDTPEARENFVDRFEWRINTNNDDIYNRVEAGLIEDEIATETPPVLKHYSEDEELSPSLHASSGDRTWYITMNLTRPPFDDVHVRKAVNFVLDKQALRLAWGGPITGEIGTHIVPDPIFDDELKGYDPYATPDSRGDVEAAKAEMSQSRYDTDGDGLATRPECSNIVHITGDAASRQQMIPVIEEGLRQIGIEVRTRTLADSYSVIQTVERNIPISSQPGWGKDYADAFTFFFYLFNSRTLTPTGNSNYSSSA